MRNAQPFCALGFSTRALCAACNRLGIVPVSVDHFADHDCQNAAQPALRTTLWGVENDPAATEFIVQTLKRHGNPKILLGGGTENWPHLIGRLHEEFEVLGPTVSQLAKLRSPSLWRELATEADIDFPTTFLSESSDLEQGSLDDSAQWLEKPLMGGGGIRVVRTKGHERGKRPSTPPDTYFQQWIPGRVIGAHCVIVNSQPELLGVTEAFSADDWPGPSEFIYRGSWGPRPVAEYAGHAAAILQLTSAIGAKTGLSGWVQFDFVESADGRLWLLEVNPRWAAGMEILVESGRANPVARHLAAFGYRELSPSSVSRDRDSPSKTASPDGERCVAKAILYAPAEIELTPKVLSRIHALSNISDIPSHDSIGQIIEPGHPLLTVKAELDPLTARTFTWQERKQALLELLHQRAAKVVACTGLT